MFSSKEEINIVKDFFNHWIAHGAINCDIGLKDILIELNTINDIATIFSCEGHAEDNENREFYIIFKVTEEGFGKILKLYSSLVKASVEELALFKHSIAIKVSPRIDPYTFASYNAVILKLNKKWRLGEEELKQVFLTTFKEKLKQFILEEG